MCMMWNKPIRFEPTLLQRFMKSWLVSRPSRSFLRLKNSCSHLAHETTILYICLANLNTSMYSMYDVNNIIHVHMHIQETCTNCSVQHTACTWKHFSYPHLSVLGFILLQEIKTVINKSKACTLPSSISSAETEADDNIRRRFIHAS